MSSSFSPSIRALEFYSGIGGLHYALLKSRPNAEVLRAFDWDPTSCQVYQANHGAAIQRKDISTLTASELAKFNANLWLMSPSCQPYTVLNSKAKGAQDPRAQSFLHIINTVLPELALSGANPRCILVENVAGFETSSTRQDLKAALKGIGYDTLEILLSPLQYGIPNSRLRYYMLARRGGSHFPEEEKVWRNIPGQVEEANVSAIREHLDADVYEGSRVPDKILQKWGRLFDIVKPSSQRTCCFTRGYTHMVERSGSILQETEELDTTEVFDQFASTQDLTVLQPLRLRYFTPSELLRLFGFDEPNFAWPPSVSKKTKYRLIGNSVNVGVVQALVTYLLDDIE